MLGECIRDDVQVVGFEHLVVFVIVVAGLCDCTMVIRIGGGLICYVAHVRSKAGG